MSVKIPIQKGALSIHDSKGRVVDYHISTPEPARRRILNKIVDNKNGDAIGVYRALLARRTLGKNRLNEHQLSVLTADANYIKNKYYNSSRWAKSEAYAVAGKANAVAGKAYAVAGKADAVARKAYAVVGKANAVAGKATKPKKTGRKTKKVIIPVEKGGLSAFSNKGKKVDYHISSPDKTRHYVLNRVVQSHHKDGLSVYRALIARRTLGKNRLSVTQLSILTRDADYVKKKYGKTSKWSKKKKSTAYDDDDDEDYEDDDDDDEDEPMMDSDDESSSSSSSSSSSEEENEEYDSSESDSD